MWNNMNKLIDQLKQAYKSWTIWFNVTGMALLAIALSEPLLLKYATENGFVHIIIIGNVLLRFKTSKGLEQK